MPTEANRALHELDCDANGFEWIDCNDADQSMLSFIRKPAQANEAILVVLNFTPVPRLGYHVGVPWGGAWTEILE
jgi:1,4-alpha-glucan branching enzyme